MILRNGLVGSFHHDLYAFDEEHFEGEELELPLNAKEMQLAFLQQDNKSWQMMVDSVYHRTGFMIAGFIFFSGNLISSGELGVNNFFSFLAAMMLAYQPVKSLATVNVIFGQGISAGKRILPIICLLYTSPSPRDKRQSRMPSSA